MRLGFRRPRPGPTTLPLRGVPKLDVSGFLGHASKPTYFGRAIIDLPGFLVSASRDRSGGNTAAP